MNQQFLLRPVREDDLPKLRDLVSRIDGGMTTLPDHPEYLENRINDSIRAFDHRIRKPGGEVYLFVLEDVAAGTVIGTSGLIARVGGFDPFYTYQVVDQLQEYAPLGIRRQLRTLELVKNHKGPSELSSLFLHPDYRGMGVGQLLSRSRFCFMKAFPARFDVEIIAELRGYLDDEGRSPFWEAVGKSFFWKDFYEADILSGIGEKDFIEALIPENPIYVDLLPAGAQEVIGRVHRHTEPARQILRREGFTETDEVDIFDAGPILKAERENLRSWRATTLAQVRPASLDTDTGKPAILANPRLAFRATMAPARLAGDGFLEINAATADLLELAEGDKAQVLPLED